MGLAAFNRMRREQAEREAAELAKLAQENEQGIKPSEDENDAQNEQELSLEEVKAKLDELGVKYSHNTGEAKLREKLANAIG